MAKRKIDAAEVAAQNNEGKEGELTEGQIRIKSMAEEIANRVSVVAADGSEVEQMAELLINGDFFIATRLALSIEGEVEMKLKFMKEIFDVWEGEDEFKRDVVFPYIFEHFRKEGWVEQLGLPEESLGAVAVFNFVMKAGESLGFAVLSEFYKGDYVSLGLDKEVDTTDELTQLVEEYVSEKDIDCERYADGYVMSVPKDDAITIWEKHINEKTKFEIDREVIEKIVSDWAVVGAEIYNEFDVLVDKLFGEVKGVFKNFLLYRGEVNAKADINDDFSVIEGVDVRSIFLKNSELSDCSFEFPLPSLPNLESLMLNVAFGEEVVEVFFERFPKLKTLGVMKDLSKALLYDLEDFFEDLLILRNGCIVFCPGSNLEDWVKEFLFRTEDKYAVSVYDEKEGLLCVKKIEEEERGEAYEELEELMSLMACEESWGKIEEFFEEVDDEERDGLLKSLWELINTISGWQEFVQDKVTEELDGELSLSSYANLSPLIFEMVRYCLGRGVIGHVPVNLSPVGVKDWESISDDDLEDFLEIVNRAGTIEVMRFSTEINKKLVNRINALDLGWSGLHVTKLEIDARRACSSETFPKFICGDEIAISRVVVNGTLNSVLIKSLHKFGTIELESGRFEEDLTLIQVTVERETRLLINQECFDLNDNRVQFELVRSMREGDVSVRKDGGIYDIVVRPDSKSDQEKDFEEGLSDDDEILEEYGWEVDDFIDEEF